MTWNASQILWQEQLIVLAILLPPIFLTSILLALNAPRLFGTQQSAKANPADAPASSSRPVAASR